MSAFPIQMTNKVAVPLWIAHGEEASRVLIGEEFCMWDVASKKIYIELVVSKLEGHGTTRNPKTFRFGEESRWTLATDPRDVLFTPT